MLSLSLHFLGLELIFPYQVYPVLLFNFTQLLFSTILLHHQVSTSVIQLLSNSLLMPFS